MNRRLVRRKVRVIAKTKAPKVTSSTITIAMKKEAKIRKNIVKVNMTMKTKSRKEVETRKTSTHTVMTAETNNLNYRRRKTTLIWKNISIQRTSKPRLLRMGSRIKYQWVFFHYLFLFTRMNTYYSVSTAVLHSISLFLIKG